MINLLLLGLKFFVAGLGLTLVLTGCSISDGAGSLSDSSGSFAKSSESSANSSESSSKTSSESKKNHYASEVMDFTATYLRISADSTKMTNLLKGVSDIASQHGIVDWEANSSTYRAIGKGLKIAKVNDLTYVAYKTELSNGNNRLMQDIQYGYEGQ